ncbi:MAG TPA: tetratricopeptide repeat protein [Spirochaetia bacterium]|nr:tetratricopeptide repeat protein [Spirochaetia bacterium]
MKRIIIAFSVFMAFGGSVLAQERPDALLLYNDGRYEEAVTVCLRELEEMPKNMDSYVVLGWSLLKLKRYDEVLSYSEKAFAISRYDARVIETVGEAYYFLGKNADALKYFEEYASLAPTGPRIGDVYYYMGEIFIRTGEYNRADIALTTAVYHSPNISAWWARLGYAREMAGDYTYASEAYDKALLLKPSLPDAIRGKERIKAKLENG